MSIAFREGSEDSNIWHCVRIANEYALHDRWLTDVIDVGAHIGAFTHLALGLGARRVIAIEPDPENAELFRFNCRKYIKCGKVILLEKAIGHKGDKFKVQNVSWPNTGGLHYAPSNDGTIECVTLDEVSDMLQGPILLKLDCEGGEYDALDKATLAKINCIVGEYHVRGSRNQDTIKTILESKGYLFSSKATSSTLGLFGAHLRGI